MGVEDTADGRFRSPCPPLLTKSCIFVRTHYKFHTDDKAIHKDSCLQEIVFNYLKIRSLFYFH